MKKYFFLLLTLFGTEILYAQNRTTSLGLTFSGDYTKVWRTGGSEFSQLVSKIIDGKLGFTAGVNASFQKRKNGAFDIGLLYMEHIEGSTISNFNEYGYFSSLYTFESIQKNHLVSIPLNWLFYFNQGKTRFYGSIGFAPGYVFASTFNYTRTFIGGQSKSETSYRTLDFDPANLYIAGTVAVGFSQYLSEHFELRMAPTYRFMTNISQFTDDYKYDGKYFPYFIGLNAGVYYKFTPQPTKAQ